MVRSMLLNKKRVIPLRELLDQNVGSPIANAVLCDLCGICSDSCTAQAISVGDKWSVDLGRCLWCGDCIQSCPQDAISMTGTCRAVGARGDLICDAGGVERAGLLLKEEVRKVLGRSLAIREVDAGSCNGCEVEVNSLSNPYYDFERFGVKIVASPRHADMLLITGPVNRGMEEALMKTHNATPEPKLVVAMGTCAISGGMFGENYACGSGVDKFLHVDMYIPGCPPHPRTVIMGLLEALGRL